MKLIVDSRHQGNIVMKELNKISQDIIDTREIEIQQMISLLTRLFKYIFYVFHKLPLLHF